MRVAYVLPSLQRPSGWRSHSQAFIGSIRRYLEPVLIAAAADAGEARALFPDDVLHIVPSTQQASLGSLRGMSRMAQTWGAVRGLTLPAVDLVHALEAYPTGLVGLWLARRLGCPLALSAHGTYGVVWHDVPLDRAAYQAVLRACRLVTPVSAGTADLMQRYFGPDLAHATVHPILNGNDFYLKVPQQTALERTQPPVPTLLSVGEVKPRKGYHLSLAAFARVKAACPQARYWIAGVYHPRGYFADLQATIQERDIRDVSFLGAVSDKELARCYQQATVFVLTPEQQGLHFEGFGLVYLEAGAYGLPVVGTRSGGVPDAVLDGETGLLAEPGDVEGIAAAILRLLQEPGLAQRLGGANRRRAETLTWERNAQEHYRAYQDLLGIA